MHNVKWEPGVLLPVWSSASPAELWELSEILPAHFAAGWVGGKAQPWITLLPSKRSPPHVFFSKQEPSHSVGGHAHPGVVFLNISLPIRTKLIQTGWERKEGSRKWPLAEGCPQLAESCFLPRLATLRNMPCAACSLGTVWI